MWISKKKWQALEKRVTDLEGQVQGQHHQITTLSDTYARPPMSMIGADSPFGRICHANNVGGNGGGGIQYPCMTVQTLGNIDRNTGTLCSLVKDIGISLGIKSER